MMQQPQGVPMAGPGQPPMFHPAMYGPMAHQYAGNEVAAALTPGSNEGSAHGKLHHSTNNSRVVLCPFFF